MENKMSTTILFLAVVFLLVRQVRTDVSCTAGSFVAGSKGSVVCDFGKDVADRNFNVVRYSGGTGDAGDYVLLCNWVNNKRECTVKSGYEFDYKVETTLTLGIPKVTSNLTGMYVCQLVPDVDNAPVHTCHLNLTAATTAAPISTGSAPRRTESEDKDKQSSKVQANTSDVEEGGFPSSSVALLVVLLLVLIIVVIVVVLSVLYVRQHNINREKDVEQPGPNETGIASNRFVKACEGFAIRKKLLAPPAPPKCDAVTFTETVVLDTKEVQAVVETKSRRIQCDDPTPSHSNTRGNWRVDSQGSSTDPLQPHSLTEGAVVTFSGEPQPSTSGKAAAGDNKRKSQRLSAANENQAGNDQDDHDGNDGNENEVENKESTRLLDEHNPPVEVAVDAGNSTFFTGASSDSYEDDKQKPPKSPKKGVWNSVKGLFTPKK